MWFTGLYIMGKDKRGIERGHCIECECEEFESSTIRCDYCGHTPMSHVPFDPLNKRPRYDETLAREGSTLEKNKIPVAEVENNEPTGPQPGHEEGYAEEGPDQIECEVPVEEAVHDAAASPQPEKTKHDEGLAEQRAAATSSTEPATETSVDNEVARFQKKVDGFTKVRRFVISKDGSKLFAYCNVCNLTMVAGKEHKGCDMFLLNQHMATSTHQMNEAISLSRESEIPAAILKIQREVEEKYPNVFSFHKATIVCRSCNLEFSATHKVVLSNIRQHVERRGHKQKTEKTKATSSKDISSFFNRKLPSKNE